MDIAIFLLFNCTVLALMDRTSPVYTIEKIDDESKSAADYRDGSNHQTDSIESLVNRGVSIVGDWSFSRSLSRSGLLRFVKGLFVMYISVYAFAVKSVIVFFHRICLPCEICRLGYCSDIILSDFYGQYNNRQSAQS